MILWPGWSAATTANTMGHSVYRRCKVSTCSIWIQVIMVLYKDDKRRQYTRNSQHNEVQCSITKYTTQTLQNGTWGELWTYESVPIPPAVELATVFTGPIWDPPGSCRPKMGAMWAPWNLLSGLLMCNTVRCRLNAVQYNTILHTQHCSKGCSTLIRISTH